MLRACGRAGRRGTRHFLWVPSRDPRFCDFVRRELSASRRAGIDNISDLWMGRDFAPEAGCEATHALMRPGVAG